MYQNILLASDGSEHALRAAENAVNLAGLVPNAKVTILYVVDGHTSKSDVLSYGDSSHVEKERLKKMSATKTLIRKYDIDYEMKVLKGDPGPIIVKYANENAFDIVIIGSRGLNTFQEMVLGSVSHKIAKRVHCPVLIVK